jgi:hypothetical protein
VLHQTTTLISASVMRLPTGWEHTTRTMFERAGLSAVVESRIGLGRQQGLGRA